MKTIFGIENIDKDFSKSVAAMGVFDGVHKGHQKIIQILKKEGLKFSTTNLVITFDPYTKKKLSGDSSSFIITSLEHKLKLIENYGVRNCLVIRKEEKIFNMSAVEFIKNILVNELKLKEIVVGEDFKFGKDRKGNINLLKKKGKEYDFNVYPVTLLEEKGEIISSSLIRKYVKKGKLKAANKALGRFFSVYGRLEKKQNLFKELKIPTYILTHSQEILPHRGLYKVNVVDDNREVSGVVLVWDESLKVEMNINLETEKKLSNSRIILLSNDRNFISNNPVEVKFKKILKKKIKNINYLRKEL